MRLKHPGRPQLAAADRGQTIVFFVVAFSIVLALAAFVIDQGVFVNNRRVAQKDADAAARAGASKFISAISDGVAPMSRAAEAEARAEKYATQNGADVPLPLKNTSPDCPTIDGTIEDAPAIEVGVRRPAPNLFSRYFPGAGAGDDIGARSTACVGSATTISPAQFEGIPVEIRNDDTALNSCFTAGVARIGMQCVIKGASQGTHPRGLFFVPDPSECDGTGGGISDITAGIVSGIDYTCQINTGSACTQTTCVDPDNADAGNALRIAFRDRLARTNTCGADTFQATFSYADGNPATVKGPPGLANPVNPVIINLDTTDPATTVYALKACFSPRVSLIVISDASGTPGSRVRGFAAVYITGCYLQNSPLTRVMNGCTSNAQPGQQEIRAVLLRVFVTSDSVGGIGPPSLTSPLTIQTTK